MAGTLSPKRTFAGRDWYYDFRQLTAVFEDSKCNRVANSLLRRYGSLTKKWTPDLNSEWTCRLFMAAKLIMTATLHVNSAYYAEDRNLRVVVPYLRYYSVLSLMRALCFTFPDVKWEDGHCMRISHASAKNRIIDFVQKFDKAVAQTTEIEIRHLKAERELISYRAPSSGYDHITEGRQFLSLCELLADLAQFNSELFEASLNKHGDPSSFRLLPTYLDKITSIEIDGHYFGDKEDAYRLDYLARKHPRPANLKHLMTEGHVEDFFGAWFADDEHGELFNPDEMQQIIFDIP